METTISAKTIQIRELREEVLRQAERTILAIMELFFLSEISLDDSICVQAICLKGDAKELVTHHIKKVCVKKGVTTQSVVLIDNNDDSIDIVDVDIIYNQYTIFDLIKVISNQVKKPHIE